MIYDDLERKKKLDIKRHVFILFISIPKIQQIKPFTFFCCSAQTFLGGKYIFERGGKYFKKGTKFLPQTQIF